jgi:iron complex outermembrane receptor protein
MSQTAMTVNGDLDDNQTTFKVGVDYQWLDQTMVYLTFAQGYKAGEFGARAASDFTVGPTDPETSDSYEIGIKSDLFDNRLRINAAAFYTKYDDLQFGVFIPSPNNPTGQETAAQNIGEATISGFEVELTAVPIDNLTLMVNYGYIDAEYDDFCADLDGPSAEVNPVSDCGGQVVTLPDGTFLVDRDHTDFDLSRAPQSNVYLSADYWLPTNIGNWFARISTSWEDNYFSDGVLNHPKAETGDFWLWDSSIGWESVDGEWRVTAWCKNCGDKEYVNGLTPTANFFNQKFYGDPQTYGMTLRWQR